MINSKKELDFFIKADCMMNRGYFCPSFAQRLKNIVSPDYVLYFLRLMRRIDYYSNNKRLLNRLRLFGTKILYKKLQIKLGFSIGPNVFGYGLVIPHHGTIVVGNSNRIGNFAVLHTSTCITDNGKIIGDGLYVSSGAKITSKITLGNNISIGANSVVNKSFDSNLLLVGIPAVVKCQCQAWYERDGESLKKRVQLVEEKRKSINI